LCTSASRRTTPLQGLIDRAFKDASKIGGENVGQLFGFDFD